MKGTVNKILCGVCVCVSMLAILGVGVVSGCGARPGVGGVEDTIGRQEDASVGDVDADAIQEDAQVDAEDAEVLRSCDWEVGEVHQITEPPYDKGLHNMGVTESNVLVAWQITNSDPPGEKTRKLQRLSFAGEPLKEEEELFPSPGG